MKIIDLTSETADKLKLINGQSYLITSAQTDFIKGIESKDIYLLLPNFVRYSRLLASGKYYDCLLDFKKNMHFFSASYLNCRNIVKLLPLSGVFWSAVLEMCIVDLSSIKNGQNVVVNPFIVDLAIHVNKTQIIKKIIKISKQKTDGKIGIWTRNINKLFIKTSLDELQSDFIIAPFNSFDVGMRMDQNIIQDRLKRDKSIIIPDYSTHFGSFKELIASKDLGLFRN